MSCIYPFRFEYPCPMPTDTTQYGSYHAPPPRSSSPMGRPSMYPPTYSEASAPHTYPPPPMYQYPTPEPHWGVQADTFQPQLPMHQHPAFLQRESLPSPGLQEQGRPLVQATMLSQVSNQLIVWM